MDKKGRSDLELIVILGVSIIVALTAISFFADATLLGDQGLLNPVATPYGCGNDIVDGTEECDDGDGSTTVTCGVGDCEVTVQDACVNSGLEKECTTIDCVPKEPSQEDCDGRDDDCDGIIDNLDADSDGVNDCNKDQCLGSAADNLVLNPNQYAQNDMDSAFESGPLNHNSIVYSMQDTHGCTCKEIALKLGKGLGHIKKGCSPSVMQEWTGLSGEPDRKAGIGGKKPLTIGMAISGISESEASWLGTISIVSIVALVIVSVSAFNKLSKRK